MTTGKVRIHGREYKTVALRVQEFREEHTPEEGWAILTEIVERTDDYVVMKASILTDNGLIVATGFAEEKRGSSQINQTSSLENCETSAIGRALAAFGLGGSEYASANEVENAIHQQARKLPRAPTMSPPPKQQPKPTAEEQAFFERARKGIEAAKTMTDLNDIKNLGREKQLSESTKEQLNTLWMARKQFLEGRDHAQSSTTTK
jgi:hypothetical protein